MPAIEELGFAVEVWTPDDLHVEEVLARVGNVRLAHAAFEAALAIRPGRTILVRHGARVVRDSRDGASKG